MASLSTKNLGQIVQSFTAAAQAQASRALDFSIGSVFLALAEAMGAVGLWLQKIALQALAQSRFATSVGPDADSWGAQFEYDRLPAVAATGTVTFTRTDTSTRVVIPANATLASSTLVQTADGSQSYGVTINTVNQAYSAVDGGYVMDVGTASVDVPVEALAAGAAGNVAAANITTVLSVLGFTASVTNAAAFLNGLDAETDTAYKARFPTYLAGLARANKAAIISAIQGVQQGLTYLIIENMMVAGSNLPYVDIQDYFDEPGGFSYPTLVLRPGMVIVLIDDGSGAPSVNLLSLVYNAIDAVRALGVQFEVIGPTVMTVNATFTLTVKSGFVHSTLAAQAVAAVQNWLNTQPIGTGLVPLTRIPQVVYDAVPGVANVSQVELNGVPEDLVLNPVQVAKAGTIQVN